MRPNGDPTLAQMVTSKILNYNYPPEKQAAPLADRVSYWLGRAAPSASESLVARDFQVFATQGILPQKQILDAGEVMPPGSPAQHAARKIGELGNKLAGGGGPSALSTLVNRMFDRGDDNRIGQRVAQMTQQAQASMQAMGNFADAEIDSIDKLAKQLPNATGADRDRLVSEIASRSTDLMDRVKDNARSQSNMSADPSSESRFKRDPDDIKEDTDKVANRLKGVLDKANDSLQGDAANQKRLQEVQTQLQEMLERIKQMIQSIFKGFRSDREATAAPRM